VRGGRRTERTSTNFSLNQAWKPGDDIMDAVSDVLSVVRLRGGVS